MARTTRIGLLIFAAALPPAAMGEDFLGRGYRPVEMLYEDVDPLAEGLRQLNVGLGPQGQDTVVFERPGEASRRLYVFAQGVNVSYDRSQYYYFYHGRSNTEYVWLMVPPNTVYHIGPPPAERHAQPVSDSPHRLDAMVYTQLTGVPDARVPAIAADAPGEYQREMAEWIAYYRVLSAHRRDVLTALDRTLGL